MNKTLLQIINDNGITKCKNKNIVKEYFNEIQEARKAKCSLECIYEALKLKEPHKFKIKLSTFKIKYYEALHASNRVSADFQTIN